MNATLQTIHHLRTIHGNFSEQPVSEDDLQSILDACVQAATASARQSYSIVVVHDKDVMKTLGYVGSKMLVFNVDFNRSIALADYMGYEFKKVRPVDFITGSTDTILAAQTAAIAAKSLGIDSLFTNCIHRGDPTRVHRLLGLSEKNCFPLIALVLGYPKNDSSHVKGRLTGPGVVYHERYRKLTPEDLELMIREYDNPEKTFLSLIANWKAKGEEHYLDYLFRRWSKFPRKNTQEDSERYDNSLDILLKRSGFFDDICHSSE